nr:hypothetical protein GCM10020093_044350 [Planobispora longispora]
MPDMEPLRPGDPPRLGDYELKGRLGEGGQGVVYLGESGKGERAAIKLLHVRFTGMAHARSRFARELAAARRVEAFCTARVLDADLDGETPYIASELIDGPSLRQVVGRDGPLTGEALEKLAVGTITALAAIHHAGIAHRDFKPDNVLLAPDGPRVVDFGIAKIIDESGTITTRAVGTPAYMAPEQIAGEEVGCPADVFAWGSTMVFTATGQAPSPRRRSWRRSTASSTTSPTWTRSPRTCAPSWPPACARTRPAGPPPMRCSGACSATRPRTPRSPTRCWPRAPRWPRST